MRFYDTSALLNLQEKAFDEYFVTSSVVMQELENIKTSKKKTEDVRYAARKVAHLLDTCDRYCVIYHLSEHEDKLREMGLPVTNDNLILYAAYYAQANTDNNDLTFCTDDVVMRLMARSWFGLRVERPTTDNKVDYRGFKRVMLNDDEMAEMYTDLTQNRFGLLTNEYLEVCNDDGDCVDILKWNGGSLINIPKKSLKSVAFGDKIKPKDIYQQMAVDSIMHNTMTVISGKAGSGKSLISLVSIMSLIESGKYERVVILFNPTSTRGASKMGYYAGDMIEKAMASGIGNMLTSKFGDRYAIDMLIQQGKIKLVSMADVRGFEIRDDEILYITEAQNTSADLMKLCLSRASQGAKIIVEGDYLSQVDDVCFEGNSNGMKRAIEVLKGEDIFGFVELQNVWRSKIAALVERM